MTYIFHGFTRIINSSKEFFCSYIIPFYFNFKRPQESINKTKMRFISFICCLFLQWVACIDIASNENADANVLVQLSDSFTDQADQVGGAFHAASVMTAIFSLPSCPEANDTAIMKSSLLDKSSYVPLYVIREN